MQDCKLYTLKDLVLYFLRLGTFGFGGPIALVGYMHRDLVEQRKWLSEEEYKEGMAIAQLAPGPLAAQLAIYIGFAHYRFLGATLVGLAFVLPSFIIVVLLGMAYKLYSGIPWMQAIFYGVGASVIGIISISAYKLTIKSVGILSFNSIKSKWLLWCFYLLAAIITVTTQREEVLLFIVAGLIYMIIEAPPAWAKRPIIFPSIVLSGMGIWEYSNDALLRMAIFFAEAGAFVFGSGLAIIPFLHGGVVQEFKWLTEGEFVDSVAVAMITPGPVVITVGFIGYLVAGFPGASVAAVATFLPCFLFTVILAPSFQKISSNISVKAFVEGITAAVIGALAGAVIIIGTRSIVDTPTAVIAIGTVLCSIYVKKLKEPQLILIAAVIGILTKAA